MVVRRSGSGQTLPCEFFYAERRGSAIRDPLLPLKDFELEILAPLQDLNGKAIVATKG
jgi:hypothetical protein